MPFLQEASQLQRQAVKAPALAPAHVLIWRILMPDAVLLPARVTGEAWRCGARGAKFGVLDNVEGVRQQRQQQQQQQRQQGTLQPGAAGSAPQVLWQRGAPDEQRGRGQERLRTEQGASAAGAEGASGAVLWQRGEAAAGPSMLAFPPHTGAQPVVESAGDPWTAPAEGSSAAVVDNGDRSPEAWVRLHASLEARGPGEDPWREQEAEGLRWAGLSRSPVAEDSVAVPVPATLSGRDVEAPPAPVSQQQNGAAQRALRQGQEELVGARREAGMREPARARHRAALYNNVEVMVVGTGPPPPPPARR